MEHYRNLYNDWHASQRGNFQPVVSHECTSRCRLQPMTVFPCPVTGMCFNGPFNQFPYVSIQMYVNKVTLETELSRTWATTAGPCSHYKHPKCYVADRTIWCCMDTGHVHYCAEACNHTIKSHEGYVVCGLTGTILQDWLVETKPGIPIGAVFSNSVELTPQVVRERASNVDLVKVMDQLGNRSRRSRDSRKVLDAIYAGALAFVTQYINERHDKTMPEKLQESNRSVAQELETALKRRAATAAQKNSPLSPKVDVIKLVLFATYMRQKQPLQVCINVSESTRRKRAKACASQIVALMAVLRLYVPGGKALVDRFPSHDFFVIGLELCRSGLSVRDPGNTYDIVLMTQDPMIILFADGKSDAALFWQDKRKTGRLKQTMQEAPQTIARLFQDAVSRHHVNPEQLRIDELCVSMEHIPAQAFESYKM